MDAERGEAYEQRNSALLKGLDPILGPELVSALRRMSHGDEIALVDANFPASSLVVPVIRLDGASVTGALDAVLSVLISADCVPETTWRMQVVDQADQEIPIFARESTPRIPRALHYTNAPAAPLGWWRRARTGSTVVRPGGVVISPAGADGPGLIDASSPIPGTRYASADFGATEAPHSSLPGLTRRSMGRPRLHAATANSHPRHLSMDAPVKPAHDE